MVTFDFKMKASFLTLILFFISFFTWSSFSIVPSESKVELSNLDSTNYLALYGEYIYKKENCSSCHTLDISGGSNKISLNEQRGKYSNEWHFQHLSDPETVVINSKMPAYKYLQHKPISENKFKKIFRKRYGKTLAYSDSHWVSVLSEISILKTDLSEHGITLEGNTKILALISYLQQISTSKDLIKKEAKSKSLELETGKSLFQKNCTPCHGQDAQGVVGPNLVDEYWKHGGSEKDIYSSIENGHPQKGMIAWNQHLNVEQIKSLTAYILSLQGSNPEGAKAPEGTKE